MPETHQRPTPPTEIPERGQGPWCSEDLDMWWVVADSAPEALALVLAMMPMRSSSYTIEEVLIEWHEDYNGDELVIEETLDDEGGAVDAWKVTVGGVDVD